MQTLLPAEVIIQLILPLAPQLGTTCREYRENLPNIEESQKGNIKFPSVENQNPVYVEKGNLTFEYEARIDFKKLDEWIEHPNVQRLDISTDHPIFLEIKKIVRSAINRWKYKNTFLNVEYEVKKVHTYHNVLDRFICHKFHMAFIPLVNKN